MINSPARLVSVASRLLNSKRTRGFHRRKPVLELLDGRILLSRVHPALPSSATVSTESLRNEQSFLRPSSPPPPVFLSLPLVQPGGTILSQTHVILFHHVFVANQIFQAPRRRAVSGTIYRICQIPRRDHGRNGR